MEKPFLFTDLIPPDEDSSKYDEEMRKMIGLDKRSIPIRTWKTGSPFEIKKLDQSKDALEDSVDSRTGVSSIYLRKDDDDIFEDEVLADEDISFEGMLNYRSKPPGEDDEEEEEEEENGENNRDDVDDEEDNNDDIEYLPTYDSNDDENFTARERIH